MMVKAIYNVWCVEAYIKHEPKIIGLAHTHEHAFVYHLISNSC